MTDCLHWYLQTIALAFQQFPGKRSNADKNNSTDKTQFKPANTNNPKLLLTIHNLPDYWSGGGQSLLFLDGRRPPRETM